MKVADKLLEHDLEILRQGGVDAVRLFLEMGRKCFDKGKAEYLDNWVSVALATLPEADRTSIVAGFMRGFFGETEVYIETREELHTVH